MRWSRAARAWDALPALLRLDPSGAAVERVVHALGHPASLDTPFGRMVRDFDLCPMLHFYLSQNRRTAEVPAELAARLEGAFTASALRVGVLRREAAAIARLLAARGIPVLLFKGLWLASFVYERPALRFMEDIDLVVPPDWYSESLRVLGDAGFEVNPLDRLARRELQAVTLRKLADAVGRDGYLRVDLHRSIQFVERTPDAFETVWSHARRASLAGVPVMVPPAEVGLLLAALHALGHAADPKYAVWGAADAAAILRSGREPLSEERLDSLLDDPVAAVAISVVVSLSADGAGEGNHSAVAARLRARLVARGLATQADRLIRLSRSSRRLRETDFSLFRFGEQGRLMRSVPAELAAFFSRRGRRTTRVSEDATGAVETPVGLIRQLGRLLTSDWRHALASYRAGRIKAELDAARDREADRQPRARRRTSA